MKPTAIPVYVESVSYTPDGEPVHIHYRGANVSTGPLSTSHICHATQSGLAKRAPAALQQATKGEYWSCAEVKLELAAHLAESGLVVEIVPNPSTVKAAEDAVTRRRAGKKNLSRRV